MNDATEPEPKKRLGDFQIVRQIGRGGMGIVYEARQLSLNRKVALKVLSSGLGLTSTAVVRFRREAEAAAKLHHTNIVPIYATGEAEGTHYYAMELIEGPSLNVVVQHMRNPQPPDEPRASALADTQTAAPAPLPAWVAETVSTDAHPAPGSTSSAADSSTSLTAGGGYFDNVARMMAEVADALDYAHNQGVIHRDIKPSNLLLSPAPDSEFRRYGYGRLSINDFGLARMLEQPGMTTTGEFMGSPLYMSPEQITAGRAPLDHRTDIYSLGATLYEVLTLQPPFPGQRRDQVIAQIMHKEPKPPRRVNKKVPVDLETICLKAIEKDPDRRYQTAAQMAEDLRRFVNRFAISAKRAGPVARTAKWVKRRPAVAVLILCLVLAVGAAGFLAYRSHVVAEQARIAEGQRALDQALVEVLSAHYDRVEPWLEQAEILDVDPGRIRVLRGLAAVERGEIETAIHELELAVEQLPDCMGAHALLARAHLEAGHVGKGIAFDEKLQTLEPKTPEDYLYGAWALWTEKPQIARQWLKYLAAEHPTPAVHYMLGLGLTFDLLDSFAMEQIDQTTAHVSVAWTQMPENLRAGSFYVLAHLTAADIYKFEGDAFRRENHLTKARGAARRMLAEHPEDGNAHLANALLALVEERWEHGLEHLRDAVDRPGFWPIARFILPTILFHLGRCEEALAELEAMPQGLRAARHWPWFCVLLTAELRGADAAEQVYLRWREEHRQLPPHRLYSVGFEIHCLLGRPEEGARLVRDHIRQFGPPPFGSSFDTACDQYVSGELPDHALLAAATTRIERSNARYYIGLNKLGNGDRTAALEYFLANAQSGTSILDSRRYEVLLHRLREDPTWPPWIPMKEGASEGSVPPPGADPSAGAD